MKEPTLSQQFAIVGLDGLEVLHISAAKSAVLRAISAAQLLDDVSSKEYDPAELKEAWADGLSRVRNLKKKEAQSLEKAFVEVLEADGVLEEVPDLLGCDMNYYTSGVDIKAYRSDKELFTGITERVRAEILEEGPVTRECISLLWLFRESGCLHDIFSVSEQSTVERRMLELACGDEFCSLLWTSEFHSALENAIGTLLQGKSSLFRNPYLEGVNLIFPFLDRRRAIFVDYVIFGTNVQGRRLAMINFLSERGHYVEEVKNGEETILKIDNAYYRVWPMTKSCLLPIQGANLVPVYM